MLFLQNKTLHCDLLDICQNMLIEIFSLGVVHYLNCATVHNNPALVLLLLRKLLLEIIV